MRIAAAGRAGPEDLGFEPLGAERLLRRDGQERVVDRHRFVEAPVGDEDAGQGAQRVGLLGHDGNHVAVLALRGAMVAAGEVQIGDPELRPPALRGRRRLRRFRELRFGFRVAAGVARGPGVPQQSPERHAAQRLLPDVAPLRREAAGMLEQGARSGEILLALRLQRLPLRDQRQP